MPEKQNFWKDLFRSLAVLDEEDRISEILCGMMIVLAYTLTINVTGSGKQEVRDLLWGALCCNLAWGLIDAVTYVIDTLMDRARTITQIKKIRESLPGNPSREILRDNIPLLLSDLMTDEDIDRLCDKVKNLPPDPKVDRSLNMKDLLNAGQIFLLVFVSTFPIALPFLIFNNLKTAMLVSNGTALACLFAAGYALALYSGLKPFITALAYTIFGTAIIILSVLVG